MARRLLPVLSAAQDRGYLGGSVEAHLQHALDLAAAVPPEVRAGRAVDLGTGGGVPGLVLALCWAASRWLLVEAHGGRAAFLEASLATLGLLDRTRVRRERAETVGRDPEARGRADLVVARGFGPPAVTAECAAPLLRRGGVLVTSEPPLAEDGRWPPEGLAVLGLSSASLVRQAGGPGFAVLHQATPCPERFPRRTGVPAKRPLWTAPPTRS